MIIDSMSKSEIMTLLSDDVNVELLPKYERNVIPAYERKVEALLGKNRKSLTIPKRLMQSSKGISYFIHLTISRTGYKFLVTTDFNWRNRHYYVAIDSRTAVYSPHSLRRYAQRQLHNENISVNDVFEKYIITSKGVSRNYILSSPTHQYCQYYPKANALFLGDYETGSPRNIWLNTCLSYQELHESQSRLLKSFAETADFINKFGFVPCAEMTAEEEKQLRKYTLKSPATCNLFYEYLVNQYRLNQLQVEMHIPGAEDYFTDSRDYYRDLLQDIWHIPLEEIDPYDPEDGIIVRGELDYIGDE